MRPIDFVQPIAVLEARAPLWQASDSLAFGTPVAFLDGGGWKMIRAVDAVGYPCTRQVRDLPARQLETVSAEAALDLEDLTARDVWGATRHGRLVGRVETIHVLAELGLMHESTDFALEASVRDRLVPRLLHDLANALTVVSVSATEDGAQALEHSKRMVSYMRSMYARGSGGDPPGCVCLAQVVCEMERMLALAASPAALKIVLRGDVTLQGLRWRLESMLLNLTLNAAAHATRIEISVVETRPGYGYIEVKDNGPGFDLSPEMLANESAVGRARTSATRGHGLRSVARQVALLGGTLSWESGEDGSGFVVRCRFAPPDESAAQ